MNSTIDEWLEEIEEGILISSKNEGSESPLLFVACPEDFILLNRGTHNASSKTYKVSLHSLSCDRVT